MSFAFLIALPAVGGTPQVVREPAPDDAEDLPRLLVTDQKNRPGEKQSPEKLSYAMFLRLNLFNFGWPDLGGRFATSPSRYAQRIERISSSVVIQEADNFAPGSSEQLVEVLQQKPDLWSRPYEPGSPISLRGAEAQAFVNGVPAPRSYGGPSGLAAVPAAAVARLEMVPGGGHLWGNNTLGGTVQIFTLPTVGRENEGTVESSGGAAIEIGDREWTSFDLAQVQPTPKGAYKIIAHADRAGGYFPIARTASGLETPTAGDTSWLETAFRTAVFRDEVASVSVRAFELNRDGATQGNSTHLAGVGGYSELSGVSAELAWNVSLYLQVTQLDLDFSIPSASRLTSVRALSEKNTNSSEGGFSAIFRRRTSRGGTIALGADGHILQGKAFISVAPASNSQPREIRADSRDAVGGLFVSHESKWSQKTRGDISLRGDFGSSGRGQTRELQNFAETGALARSAKDGLEMSGGAGMVHQISSSATWRTHIQRSFRRPDRVELSRPSGERGAVVLPNPELPIAHGVSITTGAQFAMGPGVHSGSNHQSSLPVSRGAKRYEFSVEIFENRMTDLAAVSSVPSQSALPTFAAGIPLRFRVPVARTIVKGITVRGVFRPSAQFVAESTWNYTTSRTSDTLVEYNARSLPNVPAMRGMVSLRWLPGAGSDCSLQVSYRGSRFADLSNTQKINRSVSADLTVGKSVTAGFRVYLSATNLFNSTNVADEDVSGIILHDAPRQLKIGVSRSW